MGFSVLDWTAYGIFIDVIDVIGGIGTIQGPIIGVILFPPRGLWGLFSDKTGIQLFPICRRLVMPKSNTRQDPNG